MASLSAAMVAASKGRDASSPHTSAPKGASKGRSARADVDGDAGAGSAKAEGGAISGHIHFVEGASIATHVLVCTDTGVAIVKPGAPGVTVTATPGLAVPALASFAFERAPAEHVMLPPVRLEQAAVVARLVCASRGLGAAQRAFDLAVEHAKVRKQFGELIGSFQAIQHKLANSLINLDGTRLLLAQAGAAHDEGNADWRMFAATALVFAGPDRKSTRLNSSHT